MVSRTRHWAQAVVEHRAFTPVVVGVIVLNAITLGLETSPTIVDVAGGLLHVVDRAALGIFVVDISLRLVAYGRRFWRDPWNVFDFVIVAIALVPSSGPFSVLRALRVLRVLRLISMVPSIGSQGRRNRVAVLFPHPPFKPYERFSRIRLTDDLLDMVTPPSGIGWCP